MQRFPLFLSLKDRRALGGAEQAARKIELLLPARAKVAVIARTATGEVAQLIAGRRVIWAGSTFCESRLAGVSLVRVASEDEGLQEAVSRAAQTHDVPVNVVDRPALSSFIMPAIIDRAPVTVAVATDGMAPALAQRSGASACCRPFWRPGALRRPLPRPGASYPARASGAAALLRDRLRSVGAVGSPGDGAPRRRAHLCRRAPRPCPPAASCDQPLPRGAGAPAVHVNLYRYALFMTGEVVGLALGYDKEFRFVSGRGL